MPSRSSTAAGVSIFGDDGRGPAPRLADLAHEPDVVGFADERERDVVDAQRKAEREIGLVLLGERGDAHAARRKVHARLVAHGAGLHDVAEHAARFDALDPKPDAPVVDENGVARLHVFGQPLVLDRDGLFFGEDRFARGSRRASPRRGGQDVGAARERAGADLGAAEVLQGGDRLLAARGGGAQRLEPPCVLCVAAVREVEPRDVHARVDEPLERFSRVAGGADGANYLGLSFKHVARGLWR